MNSDTCDWLVAWFKENSTIPPGLSRDDLLRGNYFDLGLIDSYGVIALIEDVETAHKIRFDEAAFQDRRFAIIETLANMIDEAKRAN